MSSKLRIELVHMDVIEETGLFADRRAVPLPAASKRAEQSVVTWHKASEEWLGNHPSMKSRCGEADINEAQLPLRLGAVKVVCELCAITQGEIDRANEIIRNKQ